MIEGRALISNIEECWKKIEELGATFDSEYAFEDIKGHSPLVEVEANSEERLKELFNKFGINDRISSSLPEAMRKVLDIK